jgi:hypothetical protein
VERRLTLEMNLVEDGQLRAQGVQLRRRFARVAVKAHVLAVGRFADHQYKACWLAIVGVDEVLYWRQFLVFIE